MPKTIIEIYGTACIYEWGVLPEEQKEMLKTGSISEDYFYELSDEVLSENTETSFLFDSCIYEIQVNGEAIELDETNMLKALEKPKQFVTGEKGDYFLLKETEVEGFLLSYEIDESFDPAKLEFHSTSHPLGDTNHTIKVLAFEYVGAEEEYGNPDGFASLQLLGPEGFSQSVEIAYSDSEFEIQEIHSTGTVTSLICYCESQERALVVSEWFSDWDFDVEEKFSTDNWVVVLKGAKDELESAIDVARNNKREMGRIEFVWE